MAPCPFPSRCKPLGARSLTLVLSDASADHRGENTECHGRGRIRRYSGRQPVSFFFLRSNSCEINLLPWKGCPPPADCSHGLVDRSGEYPCGHLPQSHRDLCADTLFRLKLGRSKTNESKEARSTRAISTSSSRRWDEVEDGAGKRESSLQPERIISLICLSIFKNPVVLYLEVWCLRNTDRSSPRKRRKSRVDEATSFRNVRSGIVSLSSPRPPNSRATCHAEQRSLLSSLQTADRRCRLHPRRPRRLVHLRRRDRPSLRRHRRKRLGTDVEKASNRLRNLGR